MRGKRVMVCELCSRLQTENLLVIQALIDVLRDAVEWFKEGSIEVGLFRPTGAMAGQIIIVQRFPKQMPHVDVRYLEDALKDRFLSRSTVDEGRTIWRLINMAAHRRNQIEREERSVVCDH